MTPASPPANGSYVYVDSLGVQHDVTTVSASNVQVTEKFTDIKGAKWLIETSTSDGASYVCRFSVSTGESGNFSVVLPAGTAVNPTDYQPNHGRQLEWIHCKFLGQAAEFTGGVALVAVSGAGLSALVGFAPGVVVLGAAGLIFGGIAGLTMIGHAILC